MGLGTMAGLLEAAETERLSFSLAAPEEMPVRLTVPAPESSFTVRLPSGSRVGGSFTEETVSVHIVLLEPPSLSAIVIVMTALPDWVGTGVMVLVRVAPLPVITILASGIRAGL